MAFFQQEAGNPTSLMKDLKRQQPIKDNPPASILIELAGRTPGPGAPRMINYAYDAGLRKMTFFVQKAELHPMLKHLRSKNLEAWSCFSNVVMGEIIVEATPEASTQALADFHFDRKQPKQPNPAYV